MPHMNDEAYTMYTLEANTVRNHESAKGSATTASTLFRPSRMARPPGMPPKKAPSRDKDAIQEPCSGVIEKSCECVPFVEGVVFMEARAGEE